MNPGRIETAAIRWGGVGIGLTAAALPWERFQIVPGTGLTLVKLGAAVTIAAGVMQWIVSRGARFPRTGLLPCIALLAAACAWSLLRSYDPAATLSLLQTYLFYALFFLAIATFVTSAEYFTRVMLLYAGAAVVVAFMTILAANGLIWPAHWDTAFWPDQRLLLEFRDGQPMRIMGASLDFNQGSLYLLVALAVLLFMPKQSRTWTAIRIVSAGFVIAAIALSMSRSGLLIAAAMVMVVAFGQMRGRARWLVLAAFIAVTALTAFIASDFTSMLSMRAQGGAVYDEGSAYNRVDVYRVALALVPRFAILGAGLGASEAAMQASEYAERAVMAIHSIPLLLLVELGVLGLAAYLWLWWRVFRFGANKLLSAPSVDTRGAGAAFAGMAGAVFVMLLFQPLLYLPLYPFVLGVGFGLAAAARPATSASPPSNLSRGTMAAVIVVTALCVAQNRSQFQTTASRVEEYADNMTAGLDAETMAQWQTAGNAYRRAEKIAKGMPSAPFYAEAAALIDLPPLYQRFDANKQTEPEALAWFAEGRTYLARGQLSDAEGLLKYAWSVDPQFAYMHFYLAEAYWSAGVPSYAIPHYEAFAQLASDAGGPVDRIRSAFPRPAEGGNLTSTLARMANARRNGQWTEAVTEANRALALDASCAEAHYLLGVDAEMRGNSGETHFDAAVQAVPDHLLARLAVIRMQARHDR